MDKSFLITVTEDDINQGIPCQPDSCPIARSVSRTLDVQNISVGSWCYWHEQSHMYFAQLPEKALDFMGDFDMEIEVEPFSFILNVVKIER